MGAPGINKCSRDKSIHVGSVVKMTRTQQPGSWLTVGKIGDYCHVSRATVRRWIRNGELHAIRLAGGHYRVSIADFRDFLKTYNFPIDEELFGPNLKTKGRRVAGMPCHPQGLTRRRFCRVPCGKR